MKTIILLSLGVLVLSMVLPTWALDPEDSTDPPEVPIDPTDPPVVLSGSSDVVGVDFSGDNVRVKRGSCIYFVAWTVIGRPHWSKPRIGAYLRRFFSNVVCR